MNRIRKLASELVGKYPNLFSADFDKNKLALGQVSIIRSTSVRNQLAGAITSLVRESEPSTSADSDSMEKETTVAESSSMVEGTGQAANSSGEESREITQAAL